MMRLLQILIERLHLIGKIPICNGIPSRAPHFGDWCFILCYRCTFAYLFAFLTFLYCLKKDVVLKKEQMKYALWLCVPMAIDGGIQTLHLLESTNFRRSITGALFGIGFMLIILYFYQCLENKLTKGGENHVLH